MKNKAIDRNDLSPLRMGCGGEGKPDYVIDGGTLYHYVGIGWISVRPATPRDYKLYPQVQP